jgi:predicted peptidase
MDNDTCTRRTLLFGGAAALATAGRVSHADAAQTAERAQLKISHELRYLSYVPDSSGTDGSRKWPLLLFLHGAGERGSDLELVKIHGPPKLIEAGKKFPFVVISPQCPQDSRWDPLALEALIDSLQRRYRIDSARIYLTGLSMGGQVTWELAVRQPERYAAVIPVCGAGDPSRADRLRNLPVWAFHGAKDDVVPLSASQDMIAAIKVAGGNPRFTIYPQAGHDSWTETYANDEIYSWLLQQRVDARSSSVQARITSESIDHVFARLPQ